MRTPALLQYRIVGFMIGQLKNQRNRGSRTRVDVVFISHISQKLVPTSPTMQLDHWQLTFWEEFGFNHHVTSYCKQTLSFNSTQFLAFKRCQDIRLSLLFIFQTVCVTSQLRACILFLRMFLEAQIFSTHLWILCACKIFFLDSHTLEFLVHILIGSQKWFTAADCELNIISQQTLRLLDSVLEAGSPSEPVLIPYFSQSWSSTKQYQNLLVFFKYF